MIGIFFSPALAAQRNLLKSHGNPPQSTAITAAVRELIFLSTSSGRIFPYESTSAQMMSAPIATIASFVALHVMGVDTTFVPGPAPANFKASIRADVPEFTESTGPCAYGNHAETSFSN